MSNTESQLTKQDQELINTVTSDIQFILSKAPQVLLTISGRASRAKAALYPFMDNKITNDEQDSNAEAILVRARQTFATIQRERMEVTDKLDILRDMFMLPEKSIDTKKGESSPYNIVRTLRDEYAAMKIKAAKEKQEQIKREQDQANEIARVHAEFDKSVANNMAAMIQKVNDTYAKAILVSTLDVWEETEALFNRVPSLAPDIWASWFSVSYNASLITSEGYSIMQTQAKERLSHESQNNEFILKCNELISQWKETLQAHKKTLEEIAEVQKQDEAKAKEIADAAAAQLEAEQKTKTEQANIEAAEKIEAAEQAADMQKMDASFEAQMQQQTISTPKGIRSEKISRIVCSEEDIVAVIAAVFYQCFIHAKYPGIYKKDKKGLMKIDEEGNAQYVDWIESLLSFYANNCNVPIPGVEVHDKFSTIQKEKK